MNLAESPAQALSKTLEMVRLNELMEYTSGDSDVRIGLIDGPVAADHPALVRDRLLQLRGSKTCGDPGSVACLHGTFIAGILVAKRDSAAPAICPGCTLLVRPVFSERTHGHLRVPFATAEEVGAAIHECVGAGARIVNLSLAVEEHWTKEEPVLRQALDEAVRRGVIVVAAAGNQCTLSSSIITRHSWVIPVVACGHRGRSLPDSNLSRSISRRGLSAPGEDIVSLAAHAHWTSMGGTSVAAAFVTGAAALLWSAFPSATAACIKRAIAGSTLRRASLIPPLLDVRAAWESLTNSMQSNRCTRNSFATGGRRRKE